MKVKVASLLRSQVPMLRGPEVKEDAAVSTYRYVTKQRRRGHTYWIWAGKKRQKMLKDIYWAPTVRKNMLKGSIISGHFCIHGHGSEVPGDAAYPAIVKQEPVIDILDI